MTSSLSHLQLFDYYLSLGIDEALGPKIVRHRGKKSDSLISDIAASVTSLPETLSCSTSSSSVDLSAIHTLEALQDVVQSFEGCVLKKTAINTVFSDGNPKASVMLIGEAPGADEDLQGKPFVGLSGQLLDRIMASIGLSRHTLYITNIIPWRPPGNRPPTKEETHMCLPFVKKHIELVRPKVLVFVGGTSAKALLNTTEGITKLRGKWVPYALSDGTLIPSLSLYHPAYLLRSPGQKKVVWKDMIQLKSRLIENGLQF